MTDKYLSKYSNGKYVSGAQYITELICENKALKDKTDLHYRFWLTKRWSAFYRDQIASAHKLLLKHSVSAIIRALKDPRGKKIYSLRAPHLPDIIEYHEQQIASENTQLTKCFDRNAEQTFRKYNNSTVLGKLKDIDNDS